MMFDLPSLSLSALWPMPSDAMVALVALFVLLQVLDAVSTVLALRHGATEANPVLRWLMGRLGVPVALVLGKLLMLALMVLSVLWHEWPPEWAWAAMDALYLWVLANNVRHIPD